MTGRARLQHQVECMLGCVLRCIRLAQDAERRMRAHRQQQVRSNGFQATHEEWFIREAGCDILDGAR
ncbi:hypothetical protein GA0004734_00046800 [Rhizobium sp. 9140]|nr:hypothetical protein GA0004734_00046800 [Rhizobium sp. 9140]